PNPLPKRRDRGLPFLVALGGERQATDPAHPFGLLRPRRQRPRRRTPEQRDERAPFHSITSSARASKVGGISRLRVLAVLRLITKKNLVGKVTGRSAGLAPLRILSM